MAKIGYSINGKRVTRQEFLKHRRKGKAGVPMISKAYSRPLVSTNLGIHPDDVAKENENLQREGETGMHFRKDGKAVFTSRAARARELRRSGLHDCDGGYSD